MYFIKDEEFIRGKCPMTKEEIRIVSIGKMNLNEDSVVLDIGSGTGSITVQASIMANKGKVVSLEKEAEAYNITKSNIQKFGLNNVELIKTEASEYLDKLVKTNEKFDSIFIGGSGGQLEDIIGKSYSILKQEGTIVMNFITLDNVYKAIQKMKSLNCTVDISLLNISKNRDNTLMMIALNPIYIVQSVKK